MYMLYSFLDIPSKKIPVASLGMNNVGYCVVIYFAFLLLVTELVQVFGSTRPSMYTSNV